jgi:D-sedoheptulose 7-phosphate isomerase
MGQDKIIQEVQARLSAGSELFSRFSEQSAQALVQAAKEVARVLKAGNKLLLFGNGGSASQAQHIAAEFVNKLVRKRPALAAIALNTDTSIITSVGNDEGFDQVFARQVQALGQPGDLAWAFSTSGNSANVIRALKAAKEKGLFRLGLAGRPGSLMEKQTDLCLFVESRDTPRIQEVHLAAGHIICEIADEILFGELKA